MEVDMIDTKTSNKIIETLLEFGVGFRAKNDPFFNDVNKLENPIRKLGVYSVLPEEELHIQRSVVCAIPNCNKEFDTIFGYESHYNSCHRNICNICHKNLPSAHLLDLHLSEKHDSFFAVQSKTKAMFACYVQECESVFINPEDRKDHCITIHKFPHDFRFDIKSGAKTDSKLEVDDEATVEGEGTSKQPFQISFGHSKVKTFDTKNYAKVLTKNQKKKTQILDDNKMVVDLIASLPE
ncbi:Zinc finger protein [Pseudolycoriella hygida]|uniref:Zinc finger protein n=1 Tax=Pseudolycoriella hygida TaxID=35572 RepID=A0A9Q0MQA4_9DIPT|nr:Zinc finger protein [Pseudolycoriella hygida]